LPRGKPLAERPTAAVADRQRRCAADRAPPPADRHAQSERALMLKFRRDGKMNNCLRNTIGQGLLRSNSEKAERFRFLSFALQAGDMT